MLLERIDSELKDAARARDAKKLTVLRALKSAIKYREIEQSRDAQDADVIAVASGLIKKGRDAASQFTAGKRPELAANELQEVEVLLTFLPPQLTGSELQELVQEAIQATGAKTPKEMGAVMKALQPKIAGRAEGKRVSDAVKAALSAVAALTK